MPNEGSDEYVPRYRSLSRRGEAQIRVKGSRFFGLALPVKGESDVEASLEEVRSAHPDAGHHAFAYRIGLRIPRERYSDDGEPSQTAGMPLLSLLEGRELVQSLVIVSRIFGGTLLGKGGLVRAYSDAGRAALVRARPAIYVCGSSWELRVPYELWGELEYGLHCRGLTPESVDYGACVVARIWVPYDQQEEIEGWLAELSSGRLVPIDRGRKYVARKVIEE
ncbi:MAG: IMPACT family protein [Bacillota bacterium]